MTLRLSTARIPSASAVERIAAEEAERVGLATVVVLGAARHHTAVNARKRAWVRLIEAGFSVVGVATRWGCDRKCIQRALDEAGVERCRAQGRAA